MQDRPLSSMGAAVVTNPMTPATPYTAGKGSDTAKNRRVVAGNDVAVLSAIYEEDVNIANWHRELPASLRCSVEHLLDLAPAFGMSLMTTPAKAYEGVSEALPKNYQGPLAEDVAEIVEMFCFLFDLKRAGLRLTALNEAMCPRFHVDKVPCRLVTTYSGRATEWLPQERVDRTKLGMGYLGLPDSDLGLYKSADDIRTMRSGDIALLKGEAWIGNENGGLVHRSPSLAAGARRLLLTVDFGG